ncbi:helix-turn-helix domain-containing protein [Streptomyces sp. SBT349]|uniref:helix-turn-helix domain-containing protein n=1 Tax=Streptomyces sp. SBT349 TaxID=1580539 RepID=UPI00066B55E3|nr:helix-turn-helix transcriptional regulator [Streptomyces sp. SBT349]
MTFKPSELTPDQSVRHLYGADLRRHRENAKLSLVQLAGQVPSSKSQLARIEVGESMAPRGLSEEFDRLFGTDGHFVRLWLLVRKEVPPDRYKNFLDLANRAHYLENFGSQLIWGMLQTEDYARALFAANPDLTEEKQQELLVARMGRQERLRAADPPHIWCIIDEAALRRPMGSPEIMRDQLARLLPLVDTPCSKIQVLPFAHGGHALMNTSMTLLKFQDGTTAAWEEGRGRGQLYEDCLDVTPRQRLYDEARAYALPPRESGAFIQRVMESYPS